MIDDDEIKHASRIVVVVQARMSSVRLPGKVLMDLWGGPLLGRLLDRLELCKEVDGIVVATSVCSDDDPIESYLLSRGVSCFRGDLQDVASRVIGAAEKMKADALVRISGDSPLLDPKIVDAAVKTFRDLRVDLVTNVLRRTFPKGQSVEVVSLTKLKMAWLEGMTSDQREHVTKYLYETQGVCSISNIELEPDQSHLQLSVDIEEDFLKVKELLRRLGEPFHQHTLEQMFKELAIMKVLSQ